MVNELMEFASIHSTNAFVKKKISGKIYRLIKRKHDVLKRHVLENTVA